MIRFVLPAHLPAHLYIYYGGLYTFAFSTRARGFLRPRSKIGMFPWLSVRLGLGNAPNLPWLRHQIHAGDMVTGPPQMINLQPFCYQQLDLHWPSLRLLQVLHIDSDGVVVCRLDHAEITDGYIALSYVWGPESPCSHIKVIDGYTTRGGLLHVRSNLHTFLLRAATCDTGTSFWVDATCINQQNIRERKIGRAHV